MNIDEYIHYSDPKHSEEFQRLHPKAREVASVAAFLSKTLFGELLITTSIFRKKTTDSGIHEQWRAIDFKPLSEVAFTYKLIEMLNHIFVYDPTRLEMKVVHPNPYHGTACHIHIQVHPNTVCLTDEKKLFINLQRKMMRRTSNL